MADQAATAPPGASASLAEQLAEMRKEIDILRGQVPAAGSVPPPPNPVGGRASEDDELIFPYGGEDDGAWGANSISRNSRAWA